MESLTTLSVVSKLYRVEQDDDLWKMKWKWCRRGQKWKNLRHFPGIQVGWSKKSLSLDSRTASWDWTRGPTNTQLEFYPLQYRWTADKCTWKFLHRCITYCIKWNTTKTEKVLQKQSWCELLRERAQIISQNNFNCIYYENTRPTTEMWKTTIHKQ
jgi:hypothetical protein